MEYFRAMFGLGPGGDVAPLLAAMIYTPYHLLILGALRRAGIPAIAGARLGAVAGDLGADRGGGAAVRLCAHGDVLAGLQPLSLFPVLSEHEAFPRSSVGFDPDVSRDYRQSCR